MTFKGTYSIWVIIILTVSAIHLHSESENPHTVSTFECISIYYSSADTGDCKIFYKQETETNWAPALDLVYDNNDKQYRGSIVGLVPNTSYDIKLKLSNDEIITQAKTLDENIPVGRTTFVKRSEQPVVISESGTSNAWHLIVPPEQTHTTIDVRNAHEYTAIIDANYVIVRGLELKNAAVHGILIKGGRHHIVIEDCHITFWGRVGGPRSFGRIRR